MPAAETRKKYFMRVKENQMLMQSCPALDSWQERCLEHSYVCLSCHLRPVVCHSCSSFRHACVLCVFTLHHTAVNAHTSLMFHATVTYMSASASLVNTSDAASWKKQKCVLQCSPPTPPTQLNSLRCICVWYFPVWHGDTEALGSCCHRNSRNVLI